jgi:hypothetical protein
MRHFLAALAVLALSGPVQAGYAARITSITLTGSSWGYATNWARYDAWVVPNHSSGCFVAPSMGVVQLAGEYTYFAVYIDSMDAVGNWSGRAGYYQSVAITGTYEGCTVAAQGGALPVFTGGASDPVVTGAIGPGAGSGGGGGGGSAAACLPSVRTVAPCPSGFAPGTLATGTTGGGFETALDGMPLQDILYAIGVSICALMGISVGTRLL